MSSKHQQQHLPLPQPSIAHHYRVEVLTHSSTRCSSEQQPSTGDWVHPIDTNLLATSYQQLTIIDKSKKAASKMAAWSLRLLYLSYYPTCEGGGLSYRLQTIQTN